MNELIEESKVNLDILLDHVCYAFTNRHIIRHYKAQLKSQIRGIRVLRATINYQLSHVNDH